MVRTTVPTSSGARGLVIDPRFPLLQESKVESTSATILRLQGCLPGFSLGLNGLVQPKRLGTLRLQKRKKKESIRDVLNAYQSNS